MWQKFLNLFKRKKVTIESLTANCNGNLASLSFDIGKAVVYVKDKRFMSVQETLDRGVGDCDEFARIWLACLSDKRLGYKPHMYICFNKSGNHAIVIFKKAGYWCYTSNDEYYKTSILSSDDNKDELLLFAYPAERYEIVI